MAGLSLLSLAGCDVFNGSVVVMAVAFPQVPVAPPPTVHLEFWAQIENDAGARVYRRLTADVGGSEEERDKFTGFTIVSAINPNDPCLIRGMNRDDEECDRVNADSSAEAKAVCGAHLYGLAAQIVPEDSSTTRELLQMGLVNQSRRVLTAATTFNALPVMPAITGLAAEPLLALVKYNPDSAKPSGTNPMPSSALQPITSATVDDAKESIKRLEVCRAYRAKHDFESVERDNSTFYVGNPRQFTKPLSGTLYGFFSFSTPSATQMTTPPLPNQSFNGLTFNVPLNLSSVSELLVTFESAAAPSSPTMTPESILYRATRLPDSSAGRGAIRFVVRLGTNIGVVPLPAPVANMAVGVASVLTNLDSGLD